MSRVPVALAAALERSIFHVLESNEAFIRYGQYGETSSFTNTRGEHFYAPDPTILAMLASALTGLTVGAAAVYCGAVVRHRDGRTQGHLYETIMSALLEQDAQERETAFTWARLELSRALRHVGLPSQRADREASRIVDGVMNELRAALGEGRPEEHAVGRPVGAQGRDHRHQYVINLYTKLCRLNESQFEEVLLRTRVKREHIPSAPAPLAARAIELVRLSQQSETGIDELDGAIDGTAPGE